MTIKKTREAQRKRTSTVDNILNHVTENNVEFTADLLAKVIDNGGTDLGQMVTQKSKVLQNNSSLNVENIVGLISGTRKSDFPPIFFFSV